MKTVIEAGHYYECTGPTEVSMKGWEIGEGLAQGDALAQLVLFVDDYHDEQPGMLNVDAPLSTPAQFAAITAMHETATVVYSEAELAKSAPQKVAKLLDDGLIKLRNGALSTGGIRLGSLRRFYRFWQPFSYLHAA